MHAALRSAPHRRRPLAILLAAPLACAGCILQPNPPPQGEGGGVVPGFEIADGKDYTHTLVHQGLVRRYYVHTPLGWDGRKPIPVLLNFHGGLSNPQTQAQASQMNDLADREDFLVVYPEGTSRGPNLILEQYTWNAGGCCGTAMERGIDDVGFINQLLDRLPQQYPVDRRRIYATGMSNGAMMVHRLGIELAGRIAAIAPVAGSLMLEKPPQPARPVPVMHFHGLLDENAPFEGGRSRSGINPVEQNSIPDTIAWWVNANNCRPDPTVTEFDDYIEQAYAPASGQSGAPVVLIILPGGGHTWPGGVDVTANLNTGPLVESVDASSMMWEFFQRFALPD